MEENRAISLLKRTGAAQKHYVVAIGASAGGLEAIHEFFDNMPENASLSFIIIQHLSPDYKSLLVELLSKHTHMKVFEAENEITVQKQCVYVIPNNKLMTIRHGKLLLENKAIEKAPNIAIDNFLYSLAKDKRDKAIAVILSGTGSDGTKGIEAVKACGGLVIVQDPLTAKFDGMLNSAITSGNADFILPPEMMPEEIYNYIKETPVHPLQKGSVDDRLLDEVFSLIYQVKGYDFQYYKTPTIIRRIGKRMGQRDVNKLDEYVNYLRKDKEEVIRLSKDFLIGVTRFFRDEPAFECLYSEVLPALINNKADGDTLKVWICACSTGEEAYSLAILIDQYLTQYNRKLDVKVFATDIDESSIEFAGRNIYPSVIEKDVQKDILRTYFVEEDKGYSVIPRIRKQIVFAKHNVIKDPPFINNDLVSCRNMLIYMNSILQHKVLSTLHFSVRLGGYLFLGSSETVSSIREGLDEINSKWKIYRKTAKVKAAASEFYRNLDGGGGGVSRRLPPLPQREDKKKASDLADEFARSMIDDFGYVCFYIDNNYEIKEAVGNFNRFLTLPEKKLNLNILKMVSPELSVALNTAVRKCWKDEQKVFLKSVRIKGKDSDFFVSISVKPPRYMEGKPYTIIVLGENNYSHSQNREDVQILPAGDHNEYVAELEEELNETRANLQIAIEGLETTNEELQSSNEELLSANEELQSGNEELQSLNEELHTLNAEHQLKIKELIELNDDLNNYFRSTDIGQVFLDADQRIRKFNSAAVKIINLIDSDIGRPISHISTNIRYENLLSDIKYVLSTEHTIEREILLNNDNLCLVKIFPYIRQDRRIDGAIITFVDISTISKLNNIISGVFNSSLSAIMVFKADRDTKGQIDDFTLVTCNNQAEKLFQSSAFQGKRLSSIPLIVQNGYFGKYQQVVEEDVPLHAEIPSVEDSHKWYEAVAVKMMDGFVVTFTDISEKKAADQKLRKNYNELISAREKLKNLNVLLEDKVAERTRELSESEERFRLVSKATNDAIWDWNLVNNSLWWSDSFYSLFGYEETTGGIGFWFDHIHPDDRKVVEDGIYQVINSGEKQWSKEYRFLRSDGQYAIVLDRGFVLHDEYGTPHRMLGSMVDVTQQREAELKEYQALLEIRKSEERFKFLANAMPQKVWTATSDGIADYFNEGWLEYSGKSFGDQQEWNWEEVVHPEDWPENRRLWAKSVETGADFEMERRLRRRDGEYRWHLSRAIALRDESGSIKMWVGTSTDIHEQKTVSEALRASEDYFRQLADESPFMIWRVDNLGRCNYVNRQWVSFTGLSFNDSLKFGWKDAVHPDESEREYKKFKNAFQQRMRYQSKFRLKSITGEYRWVLAESNPIAGKEFGGYVGSLTDITDQELAQQATKLLLQKKDEFMSIASHELKTPITSMKASLQIAERLASKNGGATQIQSFIEKANKQVNKLTSLVDDLLDVTKIQSGKLQFHNATFNIGEVIQDCLDQINNINIKHTVILEGNTDILIKADKHRLEQVIINFLSNAIKYSPDADTIILKVDRTDELLKVSVTDFGIGIPDDKKDLVFDRFFRVQESSQKFSGLGLGLFISAEIIRRHGGKVGVFSREGEGSTFWFSMPLEYQPSPGDYAL
ncbi:chemotaxis protein CheB [Arcticibacter tournemirensis]